MKGNPDVKRQFVRGAQNAAMAFGNVTRTKATVADLPRQLADLEKQLAQEENDAHPDQARIKRIKAAIAVKQQQIARYLGPVNE